MSDFSMFLKENVQPVEDVEYVASKRIIDPKTGEPVKWVLRPVSAKVDTQIKDACIKIKGNDRKFDSALYQTKLCAAAVVFPNLKSVELQDSYGVRGEEALLLELLSVSGEFNALITKVNEISNPESLEELVDEVKN